ncbi:MAG: radical SAM protein [Acidobacteria bacterium]|nr:MAG: radical SAM protein [Acidobacteriota bacterium]
MSGGIMVGAAKILGHPDRVRAFLKGMPIFPVTLELGLTTRCNRKCPDCPSSLGAPSMSLQLELVERVLKRLKGETRGLIVTGGEPTLSPIFGEVLRVARTRYDFEDIAVVTNGSKLEEPTVFEPLLAYASAVRVSLYDWQERCQGVAPTLRRIESLRKRIDKSGSRLQIGVSALTSKDGEKALLPLAVMASKAGAHWLYFHPTCVRDVDGITRQLPHAAVATLVDQCRDAVGESFPIYWLKERYETKELRFQGYHAAQFVLVIGADGLNYLATEAKYREDFLLWDLARGWREDFLWDAQRLAQIQAVSTSNYRYSGSRNRGVIYNALLDELKTSRHLSHAPPDTPYHLPHIL